MSHTLHELFKQGLLCVQYPEGCTIKIPYIGSVEHPDHPEDDKSATLDSVSSEVLNYCTDDELSRSPDQSTPADEGDSLAETLQAADIQIDTPTESPLAEVLDCYENDNGPPTPEQAAVTEGSCNLDDAMTGAETETDAGVPPECPSTPEPEPMMWGDFQPDLSATPGLSSDKASEQGFAFDYPGPISPDTNFESTLRQAPRPRMRLFDDGPTDNRVIYHLNLIPKAERHCAQLIDEKSILYRQLEAARTQHLVYNVVVARLERDKGILSREKDDLEQEIKALKEEKHCAQNHW